MVPRYRDFDHTHFGILTCQNGHNLIIKAELQHKRPLSGSYTECWFDAHGACTSVLFQDDDFQEWLGVFGNGPITRFRALVVLSGGDAALVIAGGQGYVVDMHTRKLLYRSECESLTDAIALPDQDLVIACDWFNLYALTSSVQIWHEHFDDCHDFNLEQASKDAVSGQVTHQGNTYTFHLDLHNWAFKLQPATATRP